MFEAVVNLMWIAQDIEERIVRYTALQIFDSQKYRDYATEQEIKTALSDKERKERDKLFNDFSEQAEEIQQ
jgi:hypothetical protein